MLSLQTAANIHKNIYMAMNKAGKSVSMQIYSTLSSNEKTRIFQRKDAKTQRFQEKFIDGRKFFKEHRDTETQRLRISFLCVSVSLCPILKSE